MSSTQQFATINTGLREVEAQMGSLRGLNGAFVSALTAVMGPAMNLMRVGTKQDRPKAFEGFSTLILS